MMVQQCFFIVEKQENYFKLFLRFIKQDNNINNEILNLLSEANNSKVVIRKWDIVNDQSNTHYDVGNEIMYNRKAFKV